MIKPVKCAECGSDASVEKVHHRLPYRYAVWSDGYKNCCLDSTLESVAFTKIGAILRWNFKQWRARRKMKGEATCQNKD